jgi:hypothetical protein
VSFNSLDNRGSTLRNGVYFCRMQTNGYDKVQKLMMVR